MLPWLDLGKTQRVTDHTDIMYCLLEAVPTFLLEHCTDVVTVSELSICANRSTDAARKAICSRVWTT